MKTALHRLVSRLFALLACVLALHGSGLAALAQGTAFTYQGRLTDNGAPATGSYDLRFELRDAVVAGNAVSVILTNAPVAVSNGVFEVTLDFSPGVFPGAPRWIEMGVRTNGGAAAHTILSPRQPVQSVPYAIQSINASTAAMLTGTLPASSLTGVLPAGLVPTLDATKIASGIFDSSRVPALDAAKIASGTLGDARLSANIPLLSMSAFFTADLGAARLKAGADGVLTGTLSSIGGGFLNTNNADYSTIAGGNKNLIGAGATYSAVGGGQNNLITSNALRSVIPGGSQNTVAGVNSFAAGIRAKALHDYSFVWNDAAGTDLATTDTHQFRVRSVNGIFFETGNKGMTVDGKRVLAGTISATNIVSGLLAVPQLKIGTRHNLGGDLSTITGGDSNSTESDYAVIAGGIFNMVQANSIFSSIGGGKDNKILSGAGEGTIGGGLLNIIGTNSFESTVGGGRQNEIGSSAVRSVISGGAYNRLRSNAYHGVISGGIANTLEANAGLGTIGGGGSNTAGTEGTVPGGVNNEAIGRASFAAGTLAKASHEGAFVWSDRSGTSLPSTASNQFLIYAAGGVGIGTNAPSAELDVNGSARARGTLRLGSETGSAEAPAITGIVVRRLNSSSSIAGTVIARTDALTLERDGTAGGWGVRYSGNGKKQVIALVGMNASGQSVNAYIKIPASASSSVVSVFADGQNVVHFRGALGNTYDQGQHLTEVTLTRDGTDNYWAGTVTSTFNQ